MSVVTRVDCIMELKILNFEIDGRAVYSRAAEKFDRGVNIHFHSVFIIICFAINHNKKHLQDTIYTQYTNLCRMDRKQS